MRAYSDVHDISATLEEKKTYAERGSLICVNRHKQYIATINK